jgi:hypothetical protein
VRAFVILAGCVVGFVLAVTVSHVAVSARTPQAATRLISDAHGALADICIQYRQDFHPMVADLLTDLLRGLADDVRVLIVVENQEEFDFLVRHLAARGVGGLQRLVPVPTGFAITPWARDRFGALSTGGRTFLAVPEARGMMSGPRGNDARVPALLAATLPGTTCLPLPFQFEGGDLLADESHVFLAANALARNAPEDVDNRAGLLRRMEEFLGKPVVAIGESAAEVPDHHICMFLTPLGEGRVMVADPDLGRQLYEASPATNRSAMAVETDPARSAPFHNVARCLERRGFHVLRVPLLLTATPRVFVSYNNAVLERRGGVKRVFLPVYDLPALDQAATARFAAQGWQVTPVRVASLYRQTGSLRCQIGIIRRK